MNADPVNVIYASKRSAKKACVKNLKDISDQAKQFIAISNQLNSTGTLVATFHKPMGEANMYVWFGYVSQKIFNHTWGKVSGSMNDDHFHP